MTAQTTLPKTGLSSIALSGAPLASGPQARLRLSRPRNLLPWTIFLLAYLGVMALIFAPRGSLVANPGGSVGLVAAPEVAGAGASSPDHAAPRLAGH